MQFTRATLSFSGGLDSTYLLYTSLQAYSNLDVVSASCPTLSILSAKEKKARQAILSEIEAIRKETGFHLAHISHFEEEVQGTCLERLGLGQVGQWFGILSGRIRSETSHVFIGYIKGDDALIDGGHIRAAWTSLMYGNLTYRLNQSKIPELTFPLDMTKKTDIFRSLPGRIAQHVSWCESNSHEGDCGDCSSCERMIGEFAYFKALEPLAAKENVLAPRISKMVKLRNRSIKLK